MYRLRRHRGVLATVRGGKEVHVQVLLCTWVLETRGRRMQRGCTGVVAAQSETPHFIIQRLSVGCTCLFWSRVSKKTVSYCTLAVCGTGGTRGTRRVHCMEKSLGS